MGKNVLNDCSVVNNNYFQCVFQSLEPLVDTLVNLSSSETVILCCYEGRTTGNKPELEKYFFKVCADMASTGPVACFSIHGSPSVVL